MMPAPHDDESDPHHSGFIDDNYGKEIQLGPTITFRRMMICSPHQNSFFSFFSNQGPASINLDPDLYFMGVHGTT
jgi:hypothetical protein